MKTVGEAVGWNGWGNFQCYQLRSIYQMTKNHHSGQRPGLNTFQKQKMIELSQSETSDTAISNIANFQFWKIRVGNTENFKEVI